MFEAVKGSLEECHESKFLSFLASEGRFQIFELFDSEDGDLGGSGPAVFRLDLGLFRDYFATLWSLDHLRIACAFYFTLPFGRMHKGNPEIIHLASLLGRTPSSLAMKLTQFASLDPEHQARGIRGLSSTSRADKQVWQEFESNWPDSITAGQAARLTLEAPPAKPTEDLRLTKIRLEQSTFRTLILAAYNNRCCITGNPVPELLVASHILPWASHPDHRLNPRNGLCLSAEFDRAFDRHLIAIDPNYRLTLSPALRSHTNNDYLARHFIEREGAPLSFPERFSPVPEFLAEHRAQMR